MINEVLIKQICFVYLLCAQDSCVTASLVSGKVKSEMLHAEAEEPINIFAFSFLSSLVFIFSFVMIQHIELLYGLESLLTFSLVSISPTSVDDVSTKAASSGREALQYRLYMDPTLKVTLIDSGRDLSSTTSALLYDFYCDAIVQS